MIPLITHPYYVWSPPEPMGPIRFPPNLERNLVRGCLCLVAITFVIGAACGAALLWYLKS